MDQEGSEVWKKKIETMLRVLIAFNPEADANDVLELFLSENKKTVL